MSAEIPPAGNSPAFLSATDPFALFGTWLSDATDQEPNDPNAMALATVDADGLPNVRIVLLKGHDPAGFVFYTNFRSQKGVELTTNGRAALNFHWKSLGRQVRVRGNVERVSDAEADAYYASRPLGSRIGAWASQQSEELPRREELLSAVARYTADFGENPPRPPHWSGFRVVPLSIEFWHDGDYRLHHRLRFDRPGPDANWATIRLYP